MRLPSPARTALRNVAVAPRPSVVRRSVGMESATRHWLTGGVVPLWLGAGVPSDQAIG